MTLNEVIHQWDTTGTVRIVRMGGLGADYDRAITGLIMEFCRDALASGKYTENMGDPGEDGRASLSKFFDETATRCDKWPWGGFSGAMVGAAKGVAFQFLAYGYDRMMADAERDIPERIEQHVRPNPYHPKEFAQP